MYSLLDALDYLKWQIEKEGKRMKETKDPWRKKWIEDEIEWIFERGLEMIKFAKPGEIDQEVIDYFLGRIEKRPDLARLEKLFEEEDKLEEEAKKSLKGKLKLLFYKLKGVILWWWIK